MGGRETESLERIRQNEEKMDRCLAALSLLRTACAKWRAVREDLSALEAYYCGPEWKLDYEADESGRIPADLKRGVLSQDGIGDLLDEYDALAAEMRELLAKDHG
ncbi:MAG: DUF4298 domain-containing protein [Oscillospiraceae bacterium]|nr:DUF4298 domain-containing protein [Oscillospiraceae bacterium]